MLLGKIEISKERGLLCVSREGETLFGAYFISRILSFPAYARDATKWPGITRNSVKNSWRE